MVDLYRIETAWTRFANLLKDLATVAKQAPGPRAEFSSEVEKTVYLAAYADRIAAILPKDREIQKSMCDPQTENKDDAWSVYKLIKLSREDSGQIAKLLARNVPAPLSKQITAAFLREVDAELAHRRQCFQQKHHQDIETWASTERKGCAATVVLLASLLVVGFSFALALIKYA